MRPIFPVAAAAAALAAPACVTSLGTDEPSSPIGHVVRDCVVPLPDRGAPVSLDYPDGSLWIFGDDSAVFVASADAACAGQVTPSAAPVLALTPEEIAANAARTDGRQLAIAPRGGFVAGGVATLYYDLILRGPGPLDAAPAGTGVCTLADRAGTCARTAPVTWPAGARPWGDAAFVDADGLAYVIGCDHPAAFTDLCGVARVPPGAAADATAYTYAGFSGWETDPRRAVVAFGAPAAVSASFVPYAGRYVVTVADIWSSRLHLLSATAPGGGWGDEVLLFDAAPPPSWFIGGGREHPGLRQDGGRTLAFTYATTAASAPGLHLVTFRLDGAQVTR